MATTIEYRAEKAIDEMLQTLLAEDPLLVNVAACTNIKACALVRMDDDSLETVASKKDVPVVLKKVSPEMHALTSADVHFVLIVDWHWWENQTEKECADELKAALLRIEIKKNEKGEVSHAILPWDIKVTYRELAALGPRNHALIHAVELIQKHQADMLEMTDACIKRTALPSTQPPADAAEPEADEVDPPRVVARPIPPKQPGKAPVRPARPARQPAPEPTDD